MKTTALLVMLCLLGSIVLAETDYQVGKGVEKVVTRQLKVVGHNASATINGPLTVVGDVTQTGDMAVSGDLSGANVTTTGKVTASAGSFTSMTGGTVTVTGAITSAGRIASQSGSSGELRVGYVAAEGWVLGTIGGGAILQFLQDYAGTGGVALVTFSTNTVVMPNARLSTIGTTSNGLSVGGLWNSNGYICIHQ